MKESENKIKAVCFGEVLFDNFPDYSKIGGAILNVSIRLKSFGMDVSIISSVGQDEKGKEIVQYLENEGIGTSGIFVQQDYLTGEVNVSLDEDGVASYNIPYPVAWDKIQMNDKYENLVKNSDVLLYGSLSCRDAITKSTLQSILKLASYKVFDVNLRAPHYSSEMLMDMMNKSNLIKFNNEELFEVADYLCCKYISMEKIIDFLAKESSTDTICVTMGAFGAVLYNKGKFYYNSGYRIKVMDTVGAGDSFLASLVYKLLNGDSPQEALNFACAVGALIAGSEGANPSLSTHEIYKFMHL